MEEHRFTPDSRRLVLRDDNRLIVVDLADFRARIAKLPLGMYRGAISADGRTVAIYPHRDAKEIEIWDLSDGPTAADSGSP